MIYFTSDTHFNHANLINRKLRNFKNILEMDYTIIDNWNKIIKHNDDVYILGDFHMFNKENSRLNAYWIFNQLNGNKYLIEGNHDKENSIIKQLDWKIIKPYYRLDFKQYKIIMCHYPFEYWDESQHGSIHIHGHIHGNKLDYNQQKKFDVGCDANNFAPVSIEQIIEISKNKR